MSELVRWLNVLVTRIFGGKILHCEVCGRALTRDDIGAAIQHKAGVQTITGVECWHHHLERKRGGRVWNELKENS